MDCNLPGSSIHGIFWARILEWVAISFSRRASPPTEQTWVPRIADRHFTVWANREVLKVLVAQSCPTLWNTLDCSPPVSSVHGILQARILEWVASSFSRGSSQPRDRTQVSCIAAAAKSLQSCPTLCDPIDGSPPGSPVPGILQARTLDWVAISFSNAWKWKVEGKSLSPVRLLATPWTTAYQAPQSMGFSRQEYWSGLPVPSQGIFPTQGSNSGLLYCRHILYQLSHQGPWTHSNFTSNSTHLKLCWRNNTKLLLPWSVWT